MHALCVARGSVACITRQGVVASRSSRPANETTSHHSPSPPPHPTPHPPPSVDTDCSCWANYLLEQYFPAQYALLPNDTSVKPAVPRAAQYYDFMDSPTAPWEAMPDVRTVRHGDVLAYKLPPGSTDTGHVSG